MDPLETKALLDPLSGKLPPNSLLAYADENGLTFVHALDGTAIDAGVLIGLVIRAMKEQTRGVLVRRGGEAEGRRFDAVIEMVAKDADCIDSVTVAERELKRQDP